AEILLLFAGPAAGVFEFSLRASQAVQQGIALGLQFLQLACSGGDVVGRRRFPATFGGVLIPVSGWKFMLNIKARNFSFLFSVRFHHDYGITPIHSKFD